jgi:CheY-like chemotaxis protein
VDTDFGRLTHRQPTYYTACELSQVLAFLALDPDVLATDMSMPILDGIQAEREIQKANRRVKS